MSRASSCAVCALRDARCCSSAVSSSRASRSMAASFRSQVRSCACDRISTSRRSSSALAWRMILSHWCCTRRRATFAFCASRCRIASISACLRRRSAMRASSAFMASSRARSCSSSRSSSPGIVPVDCGLGYRRSRRGVDADAPRSVRVVGGRAATFVVPPPGPVSRRGQIRQLALPFWMICPFERRVRVNIRLTTSHEGHARVNHERGLASGVAEHRRSPGDGLRRRRRRRRSPRRTLGRRPERPRGPPNDGLRLGRRGPDRRGNGPRPPAAGARAGRAPQAARGS